MGIASSSQMNPVTSLAPLKYEVWGLVANYGERLADQSTSIQDAKEIIARLQELAKHL